MTTLDGSAALTWHLLDRRPRDIAIETGESGVVTPDWAWGGSTGAGVRVCIVDSGVEPGHPMVGEIAGAHAVVPGEGGPAVAPGLAWAVEQRFDVINLSLSTARPQYNKALRELADEAYFNRSVIVASAHNARIESFPWRFSSVISVGSHAEEDSAVVLYNPSPPVEFFARGQAVPVAALGGGATRNTGNSFATPHVSGLAARILGKHPRLTTFELKTVLYLTAANVRKPERSGSR